MNAFLINRRIDLVDFEGLKLFMFEDDNLYQTLIPPHRKHQDLRAYQRSVPVLSPVTPANVHTVTSARYGSLLVLNHLWEHKVDFVVLDIGSYVGTFALKVASFIRTFGRDTKVISFDPSEVGALVPCSIELNKLDAIVKHEELAVSDLDGFVLFRHQPCHADAGAVIVSNLGSGELAALWLRRTFRLPFRQMVRGLFLLALQAVKRLVRRNVRGYTLIVRSVDILGYLERIHCETNLFVKIDIEGYDPQVIDRLLTQLGQRLIFIIFEFTPIRFSNNQEAVLYLERLGESFHLFDLYYCPNATRIRRIDPRALRGFVAEVGRRPHGYTDVFMLDKRTPGCAELLNRLASLAEEADGVVL